jgi:hypothetical protein
MTDRITVRLVCGCVVETTGSAEAAPICAGHGERRVRSVIAPPPRIRAVECEASGPLVQKGAQ